MKLFESEEVIPSIIRIKMPYVCAYLIKGKNKAALIDTGFGYGNLKQYIDSNIDMPYDVICTHGHPDHAGGNMQFDQVYLPEGEFDLVKYGSLKSTRNKIMSKVLRKRNITINPDTFISDKDVNYISYNATDEFDLGGLTLVPVHLPGHTKGIMGFLLPELNTSILGDACANPTLMNQNSSASVESYRDALVNLMKLRHNFDTVLTQHTSFIEPSSVVDHNLYWAEQILLNKDDRYPLQLGDVDSYAARNKYTNHPHGANGNIIYTLDNIWNK